MFDSILLFIANCSTAVTYYFVIFYKLLLLIMQIIFYCYYFPYLKPFLPLFSKDNLSSYFGIKETPGLNLNEKFYSEIIESSEPFLKEIDNPESDSFFDKYDFSNVFNSYFDYIDFYFWILLPIILYFFLIYFLHGMFGLYSAYVDYFQKNPNHVDSMRGFLPALFIFYFLIFIIFGLIFFFLNLYLIYILWFVFI